MVAFFNIVLSSKLNTDCAITTFTGKANLAFLKIRQGNGVGIALVVRMIVMTQLHIWKSQHLQSKSRRHFWTQVVPLSSVLLSVYVSHEVPQSMWISTKGMLKLWQAFVTRQTCYRYNQTLYIITQSEAASCDHKFKTLKIMWGDTTTLNKSIFSCCI